MPGLCPVSGDVWLPVSPSAGSLRQPHYGMRAVQRFALAAPRARMEIGTGDGTGRAWKTPRVTGRARGVGYRRCWAGTWPTTGVPLARPWPRQRHRGRRHGQRHDETHSGDGPYRTRSGDGRYGTRHPSPTPYPATGAPAATGPTGRCDRRQTIRHATILSCPTMPGYARLCPVMPGYARLCPVMPGYAR